MTRAEFKSFFDEHFDTLRRYLYYRCGEEAMATDVTQECFIKFWEKQFDVVSDPNKALGLLYKVANDMLITQLRKDKRTLDHLDHLKINLSHNVNHNTPEETLQFQELKDKYEAALARMPEGQRSVFLMSRMEGLTYKEISARLDLSVKAIEKRMSTALGFLKQHLIS